MSALRVPVAGLHVGLLDLDAFASHYVSKVNRLGAGDRFVVFDPEARLEADAVVVRVSRKCVVCDVTDVRAARLVALRPLWLLQGLSKGERFDLAVRDATALGVTDIVPVGLARCDVKLAEASESRRSRWARIAAESSRQCGRGDVPMLHPYLDVKRALEMVPRGSVRLCLWELATRPISQFAQLISTASSLAVLIGPEGGLDEAEVQQARDSGFDDVSFGPFILRTETAATAALGAVRALWGRDG
ncbi:MAG: 16S rRNA (uracil(1498)-N(3))-methyltransferase [Deltaproteobacteria bacterium]|nr:16S rRNA (uracil(1498)-N(3))-methyltransferase [Deltaproteobacteria bacterium]